jgi:beta-lactamase regulating signal transducer with metallopeptidase domain
MIHRFGMGVIPNSQLFADNVQFNAAESGDAITDESYYVAPVLNSKGQVVAPISSSQEALVQEAAVTSIPSWVWIVGAVGVGWWWLSRSKRHSRYDS